jgi:signal transduction histidine kinase
MFDRARRRLTLLYVLIFAVVLVLFSVAFWTVLSLALQPSFDFGPELSSDEVADLAYRANLERVAMALVAADVLAVALVAVAAWFLARRTLQPIQRAGEQQARFVADASHEIRSPLAAIRSTAEAALIGERPPDQLRDALTTVVDGTDRLSRVANDLLLLARSEQVLVAASLEDFDLSILVAESLDSVPAAVAVVRASSAGPHEPESMTTGEAIAVSLKPDLPVHADPTDVRRIVINLIENALRHGGGRVAVRTLIVAGDAAVEVSDRGPGIAPADLERIFQPFFRSRADAEATVGAGLGLAIALSLARRNGGRLTVNTRRGAGATFRLLLPLGR